MYASAPVLSIQNVWEITCSSPCREFQIMDRMVFGHCEMQLNYQFIGDVIIQYGSTVY